jgi:DNA-binding response OmpR family regulator
MYILVADDNDDARGIFESVLAYHGAFVVTARSARDALRKLVQVRADAVVCDVQLGDADAMWLIGEVRNRKGATPFIAVSGLDYDEREMQTAGFAAYLRKPVDHQQLVDTLLSVLRRM